MAVAKICYIERLFDSHALLLQCLYELFKFWCNGLSVHTIHGGTKTSEAQVLYVCILNET